jgi:hypothetical protein
LARRLRKSNRDHPELARPLAEICAEIEADRATLEQLMDSLDVDRSRLKPAGAWLAEKLGRLKLNGQLHGYSPLSRLVELEALCIGITGKTQMWNALAHTLDGEKFDFDFDFGALATRAERQFERTRQLHLLAATRALSV